MNLRLELPPELLEELTAEVTRRVLAEISTTRRNLLPISEAASLLGMTEPALRKHAQRGNIPTIRIGTRILIDIDAIE